MRSRIVTSVFICISALVVSAFPGTAGAVKFNISIPVHELPPNIIFHRVMETRYYDGIIQNALTALTVQQQQQQATAAIIQTQQTPPPIAPAAPIVQSSPGPNGIPAAWWPTALCEEGGNNSPTFGYFGILPSSWNGYNGYATAGAAPLSVQLAWEASYIGGPPDAPGQCHSY